MIVLEAFVNGKKLCRAGGADMATLYACLGWVAHAGNEGRPRGPGPKRRAAMWLHLEGRSAKSYRSWSRVQLKLGDQVRLKILDANSVDSPSHERMDSDEDRETFERHMYQVLKRKFGRSKSRKASR